MNLKLPTVVATLALALLGGATLLAGEKYEVPVIDVEALDAMRLKQECAIFDANGQETRAEHGVIPGAVMLSDYRKYELKELPKQKDAKVVFYCSSTRCSAAPKAAKKAMEAGYTNVTHLKVGIKGWVEAGKPVTKPNPS